MKHLKQYIQLFSAFTSSAKSEMVLLNKIQVIFFTKFFLLNSLEAE